MAWGTIVYEVDELHFSPLQQDELVERDSRRQQMCFDQDPSTQAAEINSPIPLTGTIGSSEFILRRTPEPVTRILHPEHRDEH